MITEAQFKGMMSSATDLWSTPEWLFDELDLEFEFETDVCASPENAKCRKYFTAEDSGLEKEWVGACWMNPPYGREISKWVQKAADSKATVVCLLPSRTDTSWWHQHVMPKASEIRFLRGRLKFGVATNSAPFPSVIVIFRHK